MTSPLDISEAEIRERCADLLAGAVEEAARLQHNYIGVEHLFNAIAKADGGIAQRLLKLEGHDPRIVRNDIRREVATGDQLVVIESQLPLTPRAYHILAMATYFADDFNQEMVTDVDLLLAMLQEGESIPVRRLRALQIDTERWIALLSTELDKMVQNTVLSSDTAIGQSTTVAPIVNPLNPAPPALTNDDPTESKAGIEPLVPVLTPLLDKYGRDLTDLARKGKLSAAIGREREIRAVARTLTRSKKNNPLLLGDAGVGKTAVVEGLACEIAAGSAPPTLLGKRIVQIEVSTLVAGTSLRGQFEERLMGIVDEARNAPNVILFIDEIHTIVGAGDTIDSNLDAANILKPALSRGDISCIGATTHEEYRKAIAQDAALDRRFRTIDIDEPSTADTLTILTNVQSHYADHHAVQILPEALEAAVTLSDRYMPDRRQPDKSLDLLDEACARLVIQGHPANDLPRVVTAQTVAEVLSEWTGIPVSELSADERIKYAHMEDSLHDHVIGQDEAVRVVAEAIKMNRAGLSDPDKPVGVFLFLGPSGVGKTELAKALAHFLFGTEDALVRLDMSEFHDQYTVARLIGAPPGYKDSQRGGQLTESLRRRPYSVVLLDEIEKAAPEVFDLFLQVFDEGRLTDSRGGTTDARQAVWIMTSNVGTAEGGKALGFSVGKAGYRPPAYEQHLKRFFRPEFLNRLDEIVIFDPLSGVALNAILDLQLGELRTRLATQDLTLQLEADARALILDEGTDPANGARPLRRAIERLLTRPLSQRILEDEFSPGSTLVITTCDGALHFESQPSQAASSSV